MILGAFRAPTPNTSGRPPKTTICDTGDFWHLDLRFFPYCHRQRPKGLSDIPASRRQLKSVLIHIGKERLSEIPATGGKVTSRDGSAQRDLVPCTTTFVPKFAGWGGGLLLCTCFVVVAAGFGPCGHGLLLLLQRQ